MICIYIYILYIVVVAVDNFLGFGNQISVLAKPRSGFKAEGENFGPWILKPRGQFFPK